MKTPSVKKWLGAVVAALTLTMVTSVAPVASAAPNDRPASQLGDSAWD